MRQRDWWKKAVIYELYVDKFAGDFRGLTGRLDYFTWLGVNTLWILPHYPSPMIDGGYDITDYLGVRPDLGTMGDFDNFLAAAHGRGLKVMIDMVLNHTSDKHPWFRQKKDWYLWSKTPDKFAGADNPFPYVKEKNWVWDGRVGEYYYATFYPEQPDLNWDNPEVFDQMMKVMGFWLSRGVDGLRLDAIARLVKREGTDCWGLPETHGILKKIRGHIEGRYKNVALMAETGGLPEEAAVFFGQGDECQMVLNFQLAAKMLLAIKRGDKRVVEEVWEGVGKIPQECEWAVFLTSHDTVSLFLLPDKEKNELIAAVDPGAEWSWKKGSKMAVRLAEVCGGNVKKIVGATKMLLAQPGVPIIYYGEEMGMRNEELAAKPVDSREFVRGKFDWEEAKRQMGDPKSVLNGVRRVILKRTADRTFSGL